MNNASFEIRRGKDPKQPFYFVMRAGNGKVVCVSETYSRKQNARNGIRVIQNLSQTAEVHDMTKERDYDEHNECDTDDSGRDESATV